MLIRQCFAGCRIFATRNMMSICFRWITAVAITSLYPNSWIKLLIKRNFHGKLLITMKLYHFYVTPSDHKATLNFKFQWMTIRFPRANYTVLRKLTKLHQNHKNEERQWNCIMVNGMRINSSKYQSFTLHKILP